MPLVRYTGKEAHIDCMQPQIVPTDPSQRAHFVQLAQSCLVADATQRQGAEAALKQFKLQVDQQQGFTTMLLQLCADSSTPDDARCLLGTYFKNLVKESWDPAHAEHVIQDAEKEVVKANIFHVMATSPSYMKRQLVEAISLVAAVDFPVRWPTIVPTIIASLTNPQDVAIIESALATAHSVFIRYRKLDELTEEARDQIIAINAVFTKPLIVAMEMLLQGMTTSRGEAASAACKALTTACEVLYDLISHDMGDEHEQNLSSFMNAFIAALRHNDAFLMGSEYTAGPLVALKSSVLDCISLFVQRFDEEFEKYAGEFLRVIWEIVASPLCRAEALDDLIISGMDVLCAACRGSTRTFLQDPEKLKALCDQVVLPNLALRECDVEMFEDSPAEYIERDVEGSDLHTRRRSACELIRTLLAMFPQDVGPVFMQEVATLLTKYSQGEWQAMDTAIYLVTALALEGSSGARGTKQTLNPMVPFESFLMSTILPELATPLAAPSHIILKTDVIRFIATFRSHISVTVYPGILQHLMQWLSYKNDVVYSYACHCIERLLTVQDGASSRVSNEMYSGLAGPSLSALCTRLSSEKVPNPYAMKCLMRVCRTVPAAIKPFVGDIVMSMQGVLLEASKNPTNPVFNHCLFEVLSSCIAVSPENYLNIELALWDTFVYILSNDVAEFIPYCLQVMAQLLDSHPLGERMNENYQKLAAPLVAPVMYEQKGTIPAVVRLLNSMIKRDPMFLHEAQLTEKILGVFRILLQLKQHDHEGLSILTTIILHYPKEIMEGYMSTVYTLLFQRLTTAKTPKYIRIIIIFFSVLVIVHGAESVVNRINALQPGLFWMFMNNVWLANMQKVNGHLERKVCVVALASLLCESQQLQSEGETWFQCVYSCLKMIHCEVEKDDVNAFVPKTASLEDLQAHVQHADGVDQGGFSNVFCPLNGAASKPEDPVVSITDPNAHFRQRLHALVAGHNGQVFLAALQTRLSPELFALIQ